MTELNYPQNATPLDPNEIEGLIPTHITTRPELDRWEQDNINEALAWIEGSKPKNLLSEAFIKLLHRKMFCNVWKWAGKFRQTEKNIGAASYEPEPVNKFFLSQSFFYCSFLNQYFFSSAPSLKRQGLRRKNTPGGIVVRADGPHSYSYSPQRRHTKLFTAERPHSS